MIIARTSLIALSLLATTAPSSAAAQTVPMSEFPAAEPGLQRYAITLRPQRNEANWMVEFYAGKMMEVDCNRHSFGDNIAEKQVPAGYAYWTVNPDAPVTATRRGCINTPRRTVFVSGRTVQQRYNSQTPVVVYAPAGFQVRYRLWSVIGKEGVAGVK
jgi:ecotin